MTTIKDVAREAEVSVTTVSHVLNGTRFVSEDTRQRVQAAIETLRFVPSALARSLKNNRTHTIGTMIPNCSNPYFGEIVRGIEDACFRAGYTVILCNSDDDPHKQSQYLRVLEEKQVEGVVVVSSGGDAELGATLKEVDTSLVLVDREVEGVAADLVEVDHDRGGYLATRHLLELGHRRIACISGPRALSSSAQRVQGCRRALAEAGLDLPDRWQRECDFTSAGGHAAMRELLAVHPRPTAVFAANDLSAIGAMAAAAEAGLHVPRDLSVVGFDDIPLAEFASPGLTTVSQPKHRLGELAAQLLLERIADPALQPRRRVLRPTLKARHSTAAPRRTGGRT